jgi:hypothetical protein
MLDKRFLLPQLYDLFVSKHIHGLKCISEGKDIHRWSDFIFASVFMAVAEGVDEYRVVGEGGVWEEEGGRIYNLEIVLAAKGLGGLDHEN